MPGMVRANVLKEPWKMEMMELPYPEHLPPGSAVMKVMMAGVCGTDKHAYRGEARRHGGTPKETNVPYPIITGHENYGIIEELGEGAAKTLEFYGKELHVGDRVVVGPVVTCGRCYDCRNNFGFSWCQQPVMHYGCSTSCANAPYLLGGNAEYMYLHPNSYVFKVPDDVDDELACLAEPMSCSWYVDKAKEFFSMSGEGFMPGATVVVQGAGPIGTIDVAKARYLGAGKIICIDKSEFRLNMVKDFGADVTLCTKTTTPEERIDKIMEMTEGRGADVIVEAIGYPDLVNEGLTMLRNGGMYMEIGCYADTGGAQINIHELCSKSLRIIGMSGECPVAFDAGMKIMRDTQHIFPWKKLFTHRYSLENAEKAMRKSMDEDSMKIAVMPWMKETQLHPAP